jgi:hypothetical protein
LDPLLVNHGCQCIWCVALLGQVALTGKVSHLSIVEARTTGGGRLLWWLDCMLLRRWSGSTVELLLPWLLLRLMQLSRGWSIHHAILGRSTTRTTTTRGSRHVPLSLLLLGLSNDLHCPFLINGGTHQIIVGQVGGLNQAVL